MFRRPRPYVTIPPDRFVQDTGEALLLARHRHALQLIDARLHAQSELFADARNDELQDALLDLRVALRRSVPNLPDPPSGGSDTVVFVCCALGMLGLIGLCALVGAVLW